jgi:hypothetical protein
MPIKISYIIFFAFSFLGCSASFLAQNNDSTRAILTPDDTSFDTATPIQIKGLLDAKHKALTVYKSNPFALLWGSIPFTSEIRIIREDVIAPQQTLQIGISYLAKGPFVRLLEKQMSASTPGGLGNYTIILNGFRFQASYKVYLNELFNNLKLTKDMHAPQGLYIAPHISYSQAKFTLKPLLARDIYIEMTHFNCGLHGGFQLVSRKGLALDVFTGLGYKQNVWYEQNGPFNRKQMDISDLGFLYNGPVKLYGGFNVGWSF